jgi:hypothetical protein
MSECLCRCRCNVRVLENGTPFVEHFTKCPEYGLPWYRVIREQCPKHSGSIPIVPSPIATDNVIGVGQTMDFVLQDGAFHVVPKSRGDA